MSSFFHHPMRETSMKSAYLLIFVLFFSAANCTEKVKVLQVPGKNEYCKLDSTKNFAVLASGRYVTPVGKFLRITNDPYGMSISPDGNKAVTLHNGVFTIIDLGSLKATRVPSYDKKIKSPL